MATYLQLILSLTLLPHISNSQIPQKTETITPANTKSNGAYILTHLQEVTVGLNAWQVNIQTQSSWQFILVLDNSWGFDPDTYSSIAITIDSQSIATGPSTFDWLLFGFSSGQDQFFSTLLPLDNHESNHIYPACSPNLINPTQPYGTGDIASMPYSDRSCDIANGCKNWADMRPKNQPTQDNGFPIKFFIENEPRFNIMKLSLSTEKFTGGFMQQCGFQAMPTNRGLKLYFGGNDPGQQFSIESFKIESWSNTKDPTPSPSKTPSNIPTTSPTKIPSKDPTKYPTNKPSTPPSKAPSRTPTKTPSNNPTTSPTPAPTGNPTPSPTPAPTGHPTPAPTANPTSSPTPAPTGHPTPAPTPAPTGNPTPAPTDNPTNAPTLRPSTSPSPAPSIAPSIAPSFSPVAAPTPAPTTNPTIAPTSSPLVEPTPAPTSNPTPAPTNQPSPSPTNQPTTRPTTYPTKIPTTTPTNNPSSPPTTSPSNNPSSDPSRAPTSQPTLMPTPGPTSNPSTTPSKDPTVSPTKNPSSEPSASPTNNPSSEPSASPTKNPSSEPSTVPTGQPTISTLTPSFEQTFMPSVAPTLGPTTVPTGQPTVNTLTPTFEEKFMPSVQATLEPTTTNIVIASTDNNLQNAAVLNEGGALDDFIIPVAGCAIVILLIVIARFICWKVKKKQGGEKKESVGSIKFIEIAKTKPDRVKFIENMTAIASGSPMAEEDNNDNSSVSVHTTNTIKVYNDNEYIITVHYENKQFKYELSSEETNGIDSEYTWDEKTFDELRSTISIQFGMPKSSFTLYEIIDGDPVDIDDIDDIVAGFDSETDIHNLKRMVIDIYVQISGVGGEGRHTEHQTAKVETSMTSSLTHTPQPSSHSKHHIKVGSMNVDSKLDELMNKLQSMKSNPTSPRVEKKEEHEFLRPHHDNKYGRGHNNNNNNNSEFIQSDDSDDNDYYTTDNDKSKSSKTLETSDNETSDNTSGSYTGTPGDHRKTRCSYTYTSDSKKTGGDRKKASASYTGQTTSYNSQTTSSYTGPHVQNYRPKTSYPSDGYYKSNESSVSRKSKKKHSASSVSSTGGTFKNYRKKSSYSKYSYK